MFAVKMIVVLAHLGERYVRCFTLRHSFDRWTDFSRKQLAQEFILRVMSEAVAPLSYRHSFSLEMNSGKLL